MNPQHTKPANPDTTIVGREAEIGLLLESLSHTTTGKGGTLLVAGEAGVGKTHLVEACLAQTEIKAYTGKALEDATVSYGPLLFALRQYLRQPAVKGFSGKLSKYLALLLPELGSESKPVDQETLFEAIGNALSEMSERGPCVLFWDDIQWADNATLELLPFLTDRIQNEPVTIIATYRNDEIPRGHRLRWVKNELRRQRHLQEITLAALDLRATETLLELLLQKPISAQLAKRIFEQTQGLPLFIEELCGTLAANQLLQRSSGGLEILEGNQLPIPDSIRDAVLLRIDGMPEEAREVLEIAAVAGMEFDLDHLADLARGLAGFDPLFEHNLIVERPGNRAGFRHALTREAILSEISWSKRRALNGMIADYLEKKGVAPEAIAEYWLAAKELRKARLALLKKANASCHIHAYRDAARAANRALEIWPNAEDEEERLSALERLAHCAQVSGHLSDSVKAWKEAAESVVIQSDPYRTAQVWRALATVYGLQGATESTLKARIIAATAFEEANSAADAAVEWLAAAGKQISMLHHMPALETCEKALKLAQQAKRPDVEARVLGLKGNVLSISGESAAGIKIVKDGLSLALEHNSVEAASEVYRRLGSALEYASDYTGSKAAYTTAFDYCQSHGVDSQANLCLSCMSYILFRTGDWKECLDVCKNVMRNANAPAGSRHLSACVAGLIRAYRGEVKTAQKLLSPALSFAQNEKAQALELVCHWGLGILGENSEDQIEAETHYNRIVELRALTQDLHDALPALCSAASFFAQLNRETETGQCADALAHITSATGNHEALAGLAFALGESALLDGNLKEAVQQFQQAHELFAKLQVPFERANSELRLGAAYAKSRREEVAARHIRSAYRAFRRLGARPLASRATQALRKLGLSAEEGRSTSAPERASRAGLTTRQIEILTCIADGMTNKEIAQQLFLSPRTVDMHVSHILERMDCRGRAEAVGKASELGILQ